MRSATAAVNMSAPADAARGADPRLTTTPPRSAAPMNTTGGRPWPSLRCEPA
jgi:hypothetical protein